MTKLQDVLHAMGPLAVAVSGGIDSLTLATVAHRIAAGRVTMHHATSPAVPPAATERTRALASQEGWALDVFDAGEFADPHYRANPVNRCFFCKTNLYGAVAARTTHQIVSGTNLDDLGEYRPGLIAAEQHAVRHPFVEAGIDKAAIRQLARSLGLGALAELPSAPCLSSRIETGIRIEAPVLTMINHVEIMVAGALNPAAVRCRVRAAGVVIELDPATLQRMDGEQEAALRAGIAALGVPRPVAFAPYRIGSAFVQPA